MLMAATVGIGAGVTTAGVSASPGGTVPIVTSAVVNMVETVAAVEK